MVSAVASFASRSKWSWRASAACGTRSTRLRNKRNHSVGRCPCAWVRKRCYELTESSPRAWASLAGASSGEIVPHGAYRGARIKMVVALRTCELVFLPYLLARCATGAAPRRKSRRLAEFGTERAGVEPENIGVFGDFAHARGKGCSRPTPAPRSCVKFSPSCLVSVTESEGLGLTQPEASQASLPPNYPRYNSPFLQIDPSLALSLHSSSPLCTKEIICFGIMIPNLSKFRPPLISSFGCCTLAPRPGPGYAGTTRRARPEPGAFSTPAPDRDLDWNWS